MRYGNTQCLLAVLSEKGSVPIPSRENVVMRSSRPACQMRRKGLEAPSAAVPGIN